MGPSQMAILPRSAIGNQNLCQSISKGTYACSLLAGGFVATETLVFLHIFDIYVSSGRSDAFHTLRRMSFVGSI